MERDLPKQTRRAWAEADIVCWQEWLLAKAANKTKLSFGAWHAGQITTVRKRLRDRAQRFFRKKELPEVTGYGRTKIQELINAGEFPPGFPL